MPLRRKGSDWADGTRHSGAASRSNGGQNLGGKALTLPRDVAYPNAVEAAADKVENRSGPIDIWVNCAMATIFAPFHRISPEEYRPRDRGDVSRLLSMARWPL
jgi:NAD(P)-dependent dehydrogenase (short-subunit alcohol dehydrogenase family)